MQYTTNVFPEETLNPSDWSSNDMLGSEMVTRHDAISANITRQGNLAATFRSRYQAFSIGYST
ncbi:MAG: hypothetical protein ABIO46_02845 [Chitinophagales bacterium]